MSPVHVGSQQNVWEIGRHIMFRWAGGMVDGQCQRGM